jgi:hypothetical protein
MNGKSGKSDNCTDGAGWSVQTSSDDSYIRCLVLRIPANACKRLEA